MELRRGARRATSLAHAPIFVVGAPRSGTTLLYQLLVEGLDIGWMANAHAVDPVRAAAIERHDRPRSKRSVSTWESVHGQTRHDWEPSEAPSYWYRFLPRVPHELHAGDLNSAQSQALTASVREFAAACNQPVVFKNTFHTLRIPVLADALPEARFIDITREREANARSLLVGRRDRGDVSEWWGAAPHGADLVTSLSGPEQVVWQLDAIRAVAERDLAALTGERVFRVNYTELCDSPRQLLERIQAWLSEGGVAVKLRDGANIPERFPQRSGGELAPDLEAGLQRALAGTSTPRANT